MCMWVPTEAGWYQMSGSWNSEPPDVSAGNQFLFLCKNKYSYPLSRVSSLSFSFLHAYVPIPHPMRQGFTLSPRLALNSPNGLGLH